MMLNVLFKGAGPRNGLARVRVTSFVRLLNQAIHHYSAAREALAVRAKGGSGRTRALFEAVSHFEACVGCLHRTINFAEAVKRDRNCPIIPRHVGALSSDARKRIADFRHAIEHLDDRIARGSMPADARKMLTIEPNAIKLGSHSIALRELANWITELETIAQAIAKWSPQDASPDSS